MNEKGDEWADVGSVASLDEEYPALARVGEVEVALCKHDGKVYAVSNICSHAFARLSDGFLDGPELICPLHQGSFDVRSGHALASPCVDAIPTYAVQLRADRILVNVSSTSNKPV